MRFLCSIGLLCVVLAAGCGQALPPTSLTPTPGQAASEARPAATERPTSAQAVSPTRTATFKALSLTSATAPSPLSTEPPLATTLAAPPTQTSTPQPLALQAPPLQGGEVAQVQERLLELGYVEAGWVDGVFSAQTDAAVRHFQYLNGLEVNGVVDGETRAALFAAEARAFSLPPPFPGVMLREGAPLNDDQALHARLAALKYLAPDEREWIESRFGAKTREAVQRFQKANKLEITGTVDLKTWQALFSPWAIPAEGQPALPKLADAAWSTKIFPTGSQAFALAYDDKRLWVAHSQGGGYSDNFLLAIDPQTGPLQSSAPVLMGDPAAQPGYAIGGMLVALGRVWLLFPNGGGDNGTPTIRTLQPDSGVVGKPFEFARCPEGYCMFSSAFGFDGNLVWASANNQAVGVNPANYRAVRTSEVGWMAAGGMVFDGKCMWMRGEAGLAVFNVNGGACPFAEMAYSLPSDGLAFDGKRMWFANAWSSFLTSLEVKNGVQGEQIAVGGNPGALAFDGRLLWMADADADTVTGMDVATGAIGEPLRVANDPIALLFDGQRLWVLCAGGRSVQVIDPVVYRAPEVTPRPTLSPTVTLTPTPTLPPLKRELSLTSPRLEGKDVLLLQQRLLELGYTEVGQPDSVFGSMTDAAVRHFQQVNGLAVDGVVGPLTWAALFNPEAKSP